MRRQRIDVVRAETIRARLRTVKTLRSLEWVCIVNSKRIAWALAAPGRRAVLALGLGLVLTAGCGSSDGGAPVMTHAISGVVGGDVASGVTVSLTGASTASTTTDGTGNYGFAGLADGNYTLTPSKGGYTFSPASFAVTVGGADVTGKNFAATSTGPPPPSKYAVSGAVTGAITDGVLVTLSGSASATATTAGGGLYSFPGLSNGSYTLTPSKASYTFTPASLAVTVSGADVAGRNFAASVASPTATPTNVAVSYRAATSIHVTWTNNAAGNTGIKVERGTAAAGPFGVVATTPGAADHYDDDGLTLSTQYYYRLTAVAGAAAGTPSSVATTAPPPVPTAPVAPTGVTISGVTDVSAQVYWTHDGTHVKGFRVETMMNFTGYSFQLAAELPASARTFSALCLRPGTPYLFRVTSYNEAGSNSATSAVTNTLSPTAKPAIAPSNLKATKLTWTSFQIEWTNACTTADRIYVEYSLGPSFTTWVSVLPTSQPYFMSDVTSFIYTNVPANTTFDFRASAGNALGFTATSNVISISGPATNSLPPGAGQVGIYADYSNTKVITDLLPAANATVYKTGKLTVGCFWSFNSFLGFQDFLCYSAAVHFPLTALAGKTIDHALLVLSVSDIPVNPTNYSASAIATAWNHDTLSGNVSLSLWAGGASVQGSPLAFGPYVFDVTQIVRNWVSGSFQNYGILLEDANYVFPYADSIRTTFFFSVDSFNGVGAEKNKPTLWVDYH